MQTTKTQAERQGFKDYFLVTARGFAMGSADIVPGVSGGTMAFILGIYEELIDAIHSVNLSFIRRLLKFQFREAFNNFPWRFLLALGLGIVLAFFTLAKALSWALEHHPVFLWAFFFGLVLAAVVTVSNRISRWTPVIMLLVVLFAIGAYLLVGMVPAETPNTPPLLFLSGAIAICAMILPGISGAFILVLLGKYAYVLNALVTLDFLTLFLVAAGAAVGIVSFARILRWLFKNHHDATIAGLTGLMLGSLRKVWPWKETLETMIDRHGEVIPVVQVNVLPSSLTTDVIIVLVLAVLGFFAVLLLENLAMRGNRVTEPGEL